MLLDFRVLMGPGMFQHDMNAHDVGRAGTVQVGGRRVATGEEAARVDATGGCTRRPEEGPSEEQVLCLVGDGGEWGEDLTA